MRKNIYLTFILFLSLLTQQGNTQQQCPFLYCAPDIRVSVGNDCQAEIIPEYLVADDCIHNNYDLVVYDEFWNVVPNPVTQEYFYQDLMVVFTDLDIQQPCTTNMVVEDKLPPEITNISGPSGVLTCLSDLGEQFTVDVDENCDYIFEVSEINEISATGNLILVEIIWTVTDIGGNQDSDTIYRDLEGFWDNIEWPADYYTDCEADLINAPEPIIYNVPGCERQVTLDYIDWRSGCSINRVWTITDVGSGLETSYTQYLSFNNLIPPEIIAPDEVYITPQEYFNGWEFEYEVVDDCIEDPIVYESWDVFPIGCDPVYFKVIYSIQAEDDCENISTHETVVHVKGKSKAAAKLSGKKSCFLPFNIATEANNMIPPYSYSYSVNNITWSVMDLGNGRAVVSPGIGKVTISVIVTDRTGCSVSAQKKYSCGKGKGRSITSEEIFIYPNPTTGKLFISSPDAQEVNLYNIDGKKLRSWNYAIINDMDISDLNPGIYFIQVKTQNTITNKKLIKT